MCCHLWERDSNCNTSQCVALLARLFSTLSSETMRTKRTRALNRDSADIFASNNTFARHQEREVPAAQTLILSSNNSLSQAVKVGWFMPCTDDIYSAINVCVCINAIHPTYCPFYQFCSTINSYINGRTKYENSIIHGQKILRKNETIMICDILRNKCVSINVLHPKYCPSCQFYPTINSKINGRTKFEILITRSKNI